MSDAKIPDEKLKDVLDRAGLDPEAAVSNRRQWPRYETSGTVEFQRLKDKVHHRGDLVDISKAGLAFVTGVSLAVGETLRLAYQEAGEVRSAEATVETVHSHPKETRYLVGVRFLR